jgi:hypothetical protein
VWSPNPAKPPFYADHLFYVTDDIVTINENVRARWLVNIPTSMADQYISNLKQLHAIAFDAGTKQVGGILDSS